MLNRYLGIDLGAETIKFVVVEKSDDGVRISCRRRAEHRKDPAKALKAVLSELDWGGLTAVVTTGRLSRMLNLERIPAKAALARGVLDQYPEHKPGTVVSIGSRGFCVLEIRSGDQQIYRENSRCSQGTGNFLRQLVERFDLTVEQACEMANGVTDPAALSGRCPVILKTDMTHLANKGEDRSRIIAGLYDAVCENVQVLIKPGLSPERTILTGGVCQSERLRDNFRDFLGANGMCLVETDPVDDLYLEAIGAALVATEREHELPDLSDLIKETNQSTFDVLPPLSSALDKVKRMPTFETLSADGSRSLILGFDMGSTGSKALALDVETKLPVWEGYVSTLGDPVTAARSLAEAFLKETDGRHEVIGIGATGSGREIVGSLMSSCFGTDQVFILNEIAAHSEGALFFDPEVDTIFEIGGQDAKYIRLDGGRICDAAMNEACSAGTGSFIEEQGRKFDHVEDVVQMGKLAESAEHCISLGQHCSVFMAEIIDEAVASGCDQESILSGIYDSIIQNYLNRVKGNRSVGRRIFCQGMPFMANALAAAVGRRTGQEVVVPPNPGTIGALGISLLAHKEIALDEAHAMDLARFLTASIDNKDQFICKSTKGCGGSGNKCRIDRIETTVENTKHKFVWGGNCSLYDRGTKKRKLPDLAPDPFKQRRELIQELIARAEEDVPDGPTIAIIEEFTLKGLLPFFITFLTHLGLKTRVYADAGTRELKTGIEQANVPFCAPMQLYHGVVAKALADGPAYMFTPRLRELPRQAGESVATTCPIVQASPEILAKQWEDKTQTRFVRTRVDIGIENLESDRLKKSLKTLSDELGAKSLWEEAYARACRAQRRFDHELKAIGRRALDFARNKDVIPVVVLGRAYTIHNNVLNSNVPDLLRGQGALAIPVECLPVDDAVPTFDDMYWGYSQLNLRAAHQIRRTEGVYAAFCSNYSCGPDSFNLHFFSYIMENKPFAIIETDGHTGDAGTKTRIEAFLYCVDADRASSTAEKEKLRRTNFKAIEVDKISIHDAKRREELMLLPRMGPAAAVVVSLLKTEGIRAEVLPEPTKETLAIGRQYTSGKECVPMAITTGSLLERLARDRDSDERFAFFMPTASGPCRFGVYNLLHKIILERTGWKDRVRIVSPSSNNYFAEMAPDFRVRAMTGIAASDILQAALHDVRPVEKVPGRTAQIYDRYYAELCQMTSEGKPGSLASALRELPRGMFGVFDLLKEAAREFRNNKDFTREIPRVSMVGEIYVRLDPFANDYLVEKLEERGIGVLLAPFNEWLEYMTAYKKQRLREGTPREGDSRMGAAVTSVIETGIIDRLFSLFAADLDWGRRTRVGETLKAVRPYMSPELVGEAVLTLGGPIHEYDHGLIDGVISVGPLECMPNKISEAQFCHVAEDKNLISLTISTNGDPIDAETLDRFAFEIKERFAKREKAKVSRGMRIPALTDMGDSARQLRRKVVFNSFRLLTPFGPRESGAA